MFLSRIAVDRPVFTTMMILVIIIFGLVSFSRLGIDQEPDIEIPFLTVTVVYPGADPLTVETEIVDRIEEELATLSGIKRIESQSLENMCFLVLEYDLDVDIDIAAQDARARLDAIQRRLPPAAERPVVEKLDLGAMPIMSLAVSADMPLENLTSFVNERVKPRIESVEGVGSVTVVGDREREIHVRLNPEAMRARNIGVQEVLGILQMSNIEIPGGRIETGTRELVVKTMGQITSVSEFEDIILRSTPDGIIRLSDIARVHDTLEEKRTLARLDGEDAIGLVVRKRAGANTVRVSELIQETVAELQQTFPEGISVSIPSDESIFIRGSYNALLQALMFGSLWATIIVLLFLRNPKTTLICAASIPTAIIGTFIFMQAMGFTLNMVSMLGLASCIGMLIDDAIVVLENIYRHIEGGKHGKQAAKEATGEIGMAIIAAAFSIVAVFVPVAYTYGLVGRFLYEFGMTVTFAILISLFVSFTLTAMLSSRLISVSKKQGSIFVTLERGFNALERGYQWLLGKAMRQKAATVFIAIAIFIFSLFLGQFIPQEFQPDMDMAMYAVNIETPPGSSIEVLEEKIEEVERRLRQFPEVETLFSTVGAGMMPSITEGSVQVALTPREQRQKHQTELMAETRELLKDIPGVKISVGRAFAFGPSGDLEIVLMGTDMEQVAAYAEDLMREWRAIPGFVDIDMSHEAGKPEVRVIADREQIAKMGLSVYDIATTINAMISGETAVTTFKEGGYDYDVKVRVQDEFRKEPSQLLSIPIRNAKGSLIDLGSVANVESGTGPSSIYHFDGQRSISVFANLEGLPLGPARELTIEVLDDLLPPDVIYTFGGMGDIMAESFESLFFAMFLAIILIYMILASQYENLVHPLAIMLALPLSVIGAFGLLLLTGSTMSIITMIGFIMLMGVVTKNAILLVDYINTLRKRGLGREDAILKAGPIRLRPILMTSSSTIFGLLPVAFGTGPGSEMQAPLAICIIGGLTTSMFLTLIVVPVAYSILDSSTEFLSKTFRPRKDENR